MNARCAAAGQFGTRLQGGKDASSPRYIFTRLAAPTRHLFNEADDPLLHYLNEEGQDIEPLWCAGIVQFPLLVSWLHDEQAIMWGRSAHDAHPDCGGSRDVCKRHRRRLASANICRTGREACRALCAFSCSTR